MDLGCKRILKGGAGAASTLAVWAEKQGENGRAQLQRAKILVGCLPNKPAPMLSGRGTLAARGELGMKSGGGGADPVGDASQKSEVRSQRSASERSRP